MFGIGMPELILILAIALIVIGPKKLPDLAKSLGRAMREFKKATSELKGSLELDSEMNEVKTAFDDIKSDIKDSVLKDDPKTGPDSTSGGKVADLEKDYDKWQRDRLSDSTSEEDVEADTAPGTVEADTSLEPTTPRAEDVPKKDR